MSQGYLPVRLKTLKSDIDLGFELYIQLPHKMVLYAKNDSVLEQSRMDALKDKKVRKLFIKDSDEKSYQNFIDRSLSEVMDNADSSTEEKADMIGNISENSAEQIFDKPQERSSYVTAQKTSQSLIKYLSENDKLLKGIFDRKLDAAESTPDIIMHKHAVNSTSLIIGFSEYMKVDPAKVETMGMCGLFHDIAFTIYDSEFKPIFLKKMEDMSAHELTKYKEHPKLGGEFLQDKDYASAELIEFILAHEEKLGGNGFPNSLHKLSNEQAIINLCIHYDRCSTCLGMDRKEVFEDINLNQIGNFDLELIKKFKSFLNDNDLKN